MCPTDVPVRGDHRACLYQPRKRYTYWEQTDRLGTLVDEAVPVAGCPFGGPEWQLWVNHSLVHAEAEARGATHALFVVCAPAANESLLAGGTLDRFRARLVRPETLAFLPLETLVARISEVAAETGPHLSGWANGLAGRYAEI